MLSATLRADSHIGGEQSLIEGNSCFTALSDATPGEMASARAREAKRCHPPPLPP